VHFTEEADLHTIFDGAFTGTPITVLLLPNGLQFIGQSAFSNCRELATAGLSARSQLDTIDDFAFLSSSVFVMQFPPALKQIGKAAFAQCPDLVRVEFAEGSQLAEIGNFAFNDFSVESIVLPESLAKFGTCVFGNAFNLVEIDSLSDSFVVEAGILYDHSKNRLIVASRLIEEVEIPSTVMAIEQFAFANCRHLVTVTFPENSILAHIHDSAFQKSGVEAIVFPSILEEVGDRAFFDTNLKEVQIGKAVKSIGKDAFSSCKLLRQIVLGSSTTQFDHSGLSCEVIFSDQPATKKTRPQITSIFDLTTLREEAEVGRGKFGVCKLMRKPDGSVFVQKMIAKGISDSNPDDRFLPFVEQLLSLRHPTLVEFRGFASDKANYYLFSEVLGQKSLKEKPQLNATQKVCTIIGMAAALQHLHRAGIVHGALKPENVLLDDMMGVKLTDFGLLALELDGVIEARTLGTAGYSPPEQFDGVFGPKGDVYSFGLLVYEIIVGKSVFAPTLSSMAVIKKAISGERAPIPAAVSAFTRGLIESCWSADPNDRKPSDALFRDIADNYPALCPDVNMPKVQAYVQMLQ
jgi:serine/threonine protein kinase